ncbi:response regulator [Chroogloeocystis siderophila]|jgi:DNA-binding response OmpR family regulator|uniref:Two-component system response regulator n=1 Tax=Chroogloeocystis siderophila 5.2 s.c.1 TaxID=247279 RepID=A0A1U7HU57_9CHRO|nr:response regulator [Chroogloeocystis siderophila]OKH27064.1 two-component system response regulator [Chroogloeocystis siderophila 5.2 s.c.1]
MTKRILMVDDDEDICKLVQIALEKFAGWTTIVAESGQEGLFIAKTQPLDAILLDVSMPDIDGVQLFTQLQADATTCSIPVILLTAKILPSDRQRFAQISVAGVITKPFNPLTIWTQIAAILGW